MLHLGTPLSIPDVIEEHLEVLPLLWALRTAFLDADHVTLRALIDHDERLDAHAEGLALAGDDVRESLEAALASEEPGAALAATHVLLRIGDDAASDAVRMALESAKGVALEGIGAGLCVGEQASIRAALLELTVSGAPAAAATACNALAFQGAATPESTRRLIEWLDAGDPDAAQAACRCLAALGSAGVAGFNTDLKPRLELAAQAEDARLRQAALDAAAWTSQPWLLEFCRGRCASPVPYDFEAAFMLAVLGTHADLAHVQRAGNAGALGARRFRILGAFGHPGVVPGLLQVMRDEDAECAAGAGAAFTRITGFDVESGTRARVAPEGLEPDEFELEFLEELQLPDPDKAEAFWKERASAFGTSTRWCQGDDVGGDKSPPPMDRWGLAPRREALMRGRYRGVLSGGPAELGSLMTHS